MAGSGHNHRAFGPLATILASAWAVFGCQHLVLQRWSSAAVELTIGGLIAAILFTTRSRPKLHGYAGELVMALTCVGLVGTALLSGGRASSTLWFIALLPAAAMVIAKRRHFLPWALVAAAAVAFVHLVGAQLVGPEFTSGEDEVMLAQLLMLVVAVLVTHAAAEASSRRFRKAESYVAQLRSQRDRANQGNRLIHAILEQSHAGKCLLSPKGKVLHVNREFADTFSLSAAAVVGLHIDKLMRSFVARHVSDSDQLEGLIEALSDYVIRQEITLADGGVLQATLTPLTRSRGDSIGYLLETVDITERAAREQELVATINRDQLTGLANRRRIESDLRSRCASAEQQPFALLMIDLDGFKSINDEYGHDAGDQVLKKVAERMCATVRSGDIVARLGGDEFTVVMPGAGASKRPIHTLLKLVEILSQPIDLTNQTVSVSASIGVAFFPDHARDPESLKRTADAAMYDAKDSGKNRFIVAGSTGAHRSVSPLPA
ncbi:MAG: sensor domain-containing diguanylate cyclase [Deltaproteobacteria bacterium]|jgi:diguanylate cyclase (GGDEF)-like protein/PAS domain S-box-containing protein|nr:sensor domain-containing diguanylate cyclase [Deltaproteobacteria bacterium]